MVYPEEDRSLEHHNGGNAEHENAVQGFVADEQHAGETPGPPPTSAQKNSVRSGTRFQLRAAASLS